MSKREQLMEYITQDVVAFLAEDRQLDFAEAMRIFYTSETYERILDEETGLYLEGAAYIYDILTTELDHGGLTQPEY
ncbi:hypothetical protein FMM80_24785 [Schaedlerella arabinosiphila]|uniref:DUF3791 domain-containing protein n=1 Tax=Schaedlerella arabinosiphila TaxID=2044587 RepID=A0A9X5H8U9_9FIRM|nr:hypothetical protein [Schaedlerella arabinosiphila]KAI4444553.1 hypothetical protein C824_000987 [Schaedlerella arabinosiphila]MCI9604043.1 hypothetical protein [Ruminococcus sp.]MCI9634409.1 hypothetical protein [Ruminococcus sp.]NDO71693.1 hypothetical protein [Schaedlerella arabinosiphila]